MKNITVLLLSLIIVAGYLLDVGLVLSEHVDTTDPNKLLMIGQAVGGLQAMAMMVASYYFGTTKGSEDKNAAVSDVIAKLPASPVTTATASVTTTKGE